MRVAVRVRKVERRVNEKAMRSLFAKEPGVWMLLAIFLISGGGIRGKIRKNYRDGGKASHRKSKGSSIEGVLYTLSTFNRKPELQENKEKIGEKANLAMPFGRGGEERTLRNSIVVGGVLRIPFEYNLLRMEHEGWK